MAVDLPKILLADCIIDPPSLEIAAWKIIGKIEDEDSLILFLSDSRNVSRLLHDGHRVITPVYHCAFVCNHATEQSRATTYRPPF